MTLALAQGRPGIVAVCSAHPLVIETALIAARDAGQPILIEATCNQVNQEGGYTGQTPAVFRAGVLAIAARAATGPVLLGGDHLGPNPWRQLAAATAMERAGAMVEAYVRAGFVKLHLDCSMGCAGEPAAVGDGVAAARAAALAARAEATATGAGLPPPVYVIGTEVPTPGGAGADEPPLTVTAPGAVAATLEAHRDSFAAFGLLAAFDRVIALVVQPGVEFGPLGVHAYDRDAAAGLAASRTDLGGRVFEAHSTDYQTPGALAALVADGFAILKVGPALTHALRAALYALDSFAGSSPSSLPAAMERLMQADPQHWAGHVRDPASWEERHAGLSDRIRYYWTLPEAEAAVSALLARLAGWSIPDLGPLRGAPDAGSFLRQAVGAVLAPYLAACAGSGSTAIR